MRTHAYRTHMYTHAMRTHTHMPRSSSNRDGTEGGTAWMSPKAATESFEPNIFLAQSATSGATFDTGHVPVTGRSVTGRTEAQMELKETVL